MKKSIGGIILVEKKRDHVEKELRKNPGHTFNESLRHAFIGTPQELFRGGCFQFLITLIILGLLILIANLFFFK